MTRRLRAQQTGNMPGALLLASVTLATFIPSAHVAHAQATKQAAAQSAAVPPLPASPNAHVATTPSPTPPATTPSDLQAQATLRADWLSRAALLPLAKTQSISPPVHPLHTTDVARLASDERGSAWMPIQRGLTAWLGGEARVRAHGMYNLDLDRGLDSRGQPLYPLPPPGDSATFGRQWLRGGEARVRLDGGVLWPRYLAAIKGRIDLGGGHASIGHALPSGLNAPAATVKRLWGEFMTPLGGFALGRTSTHFGLGLVAHGGDCQSCDGGAAADRIAWALAIGEHVVSLSWDLQTVLLGRRDETHYARNSVAFEPTATPDVQTALWGKFRSNTTQARMLGAGRTSLEYAAYVSHSYEGSAGGVARKARAVAAGGWARWVGPRFRVEGESAALRGRIAQPSLVPGIELTQDATFAQLGAAVQSAFALGPLSLGLDAGFASGDRAPGFGVTTSTNAASAGALDGAQFDFPRDTTLNNFRFARDYHIDLILFREIVGTVTDAMYVRPHAEATFWQRGSRALTLSGALITSWSQYASSTPNQRRWLGTEIDATLAYRSEHIWASLETGVLWPGPAFDAPTLSAHLAHAMRATMGVTF